MTDIPSTPFTDPRSGARITSLRPCRHGLMLYPRHDMYVGRSLDRYGEYSEGEVALFSRILRPGDVAVEAGANIGAHTLFLARHVGPAGRVIALEPQRFVHQILCANMALNELTNVHAFHAAAGETRGVIQVPFLDLGKTQNVGGLSIAGGTGTAGGGGEPVPVMPIDDLGLSRCRLLKADVEGMEISVLKGAARTIRRHRPVLYVENDREEHSPGLIALIQSLGYRLWWHLPSLYNPANFDGREENVFGRIVSVNLFCVPREMAQRIDGLREVSGPEDRWNVSPA